MASYALRHLEELAGLPRDRGPCSRPAQNIRRRALRILRDNAFGYKARAPTFSRSVAVVNGLLGDALGQMFAERYFSPETKAQVQAIVADLIAAYRRRIDALSWMDAATKAEAKVKLSTLYVGIGCPETWIDYADYEVKADDLFGNLWRSRLFEYHRSVAHLGRAVDRKEWAWRYYPQTLDMVELPLQNAINLPAANFQPPYFDPQAPAAVNYGAIGATIGHEISHTLTPKAARLIRRARCAIGGRTRT